MLADRMRYNDRFTVEFFTRYLIPYWVPTHTEELLLQGPRDRKFVLAYCEVGRNFIGRPLLKTVLFPLRP